MNLGGPGNDAYCGPADTRVAFALENGLFGAERIQKNEYKYGACEF
jgi:hypothetical protein